MTFMKPINIAAFSVAFVFVAAVLFGVITV